jgi:hypothetical protein
MNFVVNMSNTIHSIPNKKKKGSAEQVERSVSQFLQNQQAMDSVIWDYDPRSIADTFKFDSAFVLQSFNDQSMIDAFTSNLWKGSSNE